MIDVQMLSGLCRGTGIAIAARQRWSALPMDRDVVFVDVLSVAALREGHPEWFALPLAPVRRVEDALLLPSTGNDSLDFLVCFPLVQTAVGLDRLLQTAQRVLRSSGTLVLTMSDERYVDDQDVAARQAFADWRAIERELGIDESGRPWTSARLGHVVTTLLAGGDATLGVEVTGRFGAEAIVVLQLPGTGSQRTGDLLECMGRIYAVDGRFVRHVQSPAVLELLQAGARPIRAIDEQEMMTLVVGRPVRPQDVGPLLARREAAA